MPTATRIPTSERVTVHDLLVFTIEEGPVFERPVLVLTDDGALHEVTAVEVWGLGEDLPDDRLVLVVAPSETPQTTR